MIYFEGLAMSDIVEGADKEKSKPETGSGITNSQVCDAVFKEYTTLRDEILMWTRSELTAIGILFSIDSVLFGYAITPGKHALFLLIPPITFAGTWLWISDHCMIRILSAYISEVIEAKKIPEVIGKRNDGSLWIGWTHLFRIYPAS